MSLFEMNVVIQYWNEAMTELICDQHFEVIFLLSLWLLPPFEIYMEHGKKKCVKSMCGKLI